MAAMSTCEFCSGILVPGADTRGRKPRFCSASCRSAAWRQRQRDAQAAELEQARSQISLDLRTPEDVLADVIQEIHAATRVVTSRGEVPAHLTEMVSAAQALTDAARRSAVPQTQSLSRQQRRKLARKKH